MKKITVLEELNFVWEPEKIEKVKELWKSDSHIAEISREVKRSQCEVFLLLLELSLKKEIKERELGILGG